MSKLNGGLQELEETGYWLELLAESGLIKAELLEDLMNETNELTAILITCIKHAKEKQKSER